jgi:hypothetical protein
MSAIISTAKHLKFVFGATAGVLFNVPPGAH